MRRILLVAIVCVTMTAGFVSAQQPAVTGRARVVSRARGGGLLLPGTRATAFATIQGNALSSTNGALPDTIVRLRDARLGTIIDTQLTDKSGLFVFRAVDPGSYIVEMLGGDRNSVVAASQLLNVSAGDAISAVVKLPFRVPPFAGLLGNSVPAAATVTSSAAASGVMAATVAGAQTCSTIQ